MPLSQPGAGPVAISAEVSSGSGPGGRQATAFRLIQAAGGFVEVVSGVRECLFRGPAWFAANQVGL
jgi:hypothetical protein